MPNHVTNELIFRRLSIQKIAELRSACLNSDNRIDFEVLLPMPKNIWWHSVDKRHEVFPDNCLDWAQREWGTKWNAYGAAEMEVHDDIAILRFDTAWSPPYGWLVAIFNSTGLDFEHNWLIEGEMRGHSGTWDHSSPDDEWVERPCDDDMQKHLHLLRWGCEESADDD